MEKSVERAIRDIGIIKSVMERTQKDFSKVSMFFVWIGMINVLKFIVEQMAYYFRNVDGYQSGLSVFLTWTGQVLPLVAYGVCFLVFYRRMKTTDNTISLGLLRTWGFVLIGFQIFAFAYLFLLPAGNDGRIQMMWRCKELIEILPVIVILFVTGALTQMKAVTIATGVYGIVYLVLFTGMQEVRYGMLGGIGTRVSASSISIRIVMTAGMILLGLLLKKGVNRNGNQYNTGSISDKA